MKKRIKLIGLLGAAFLAVSGGLTFYMQASHADQIAAQQCTGRDLVAQLETANPEILAGIRKTAETVPNGQGVLWRIEKEGVADSFVFGTMHMSDPRLLDLDPAVKDAFAQSQLLALELTDVLDPAKMKEKAGSFVQYTAYTDGSDITSRLDAEQLEATKAVFTERSSIPWFLAKRLKPWALMGAMAAPACETARKAAGKPFLDQMLAQMAEQRSMPMVSLETIESQITAMAGLPEPVMIRALVETARLADQIDDIFETMIALYDKGDIATVWAMMKHVGPDGLQAQSSGLKYADFQRDIVERRNEGMVEAALPLIDKGGAFIAIGALHLPGETGMVSLLEQKGYRVSPIGS